MKGTLKNFWNLFGKNTSGGQVADSKKNGCENTTESTETAFKSNEINTKTNQMSLHTYQWIKGEHIGQIRKSDGSTITEGNLEFLVFTDGSRCNTSLINDYIIQIESEDPSDLILLNDLAPQPLTRVEESKPTFSPPPVAPQQVTETPISLSPLESILHTSKKVKKRVTITVEVEVPPADLIKVVAASFEDGDKQVLKYLKKGWTAEEQLNVQTQVAEFIMNSVFKSSKKQD